MRPDHLATRELQSTAVQVTKPFDLLTVVEQYMVLSLSRVQIVLPGANCAYGLALPPRTSTVLGFQASPEQRPVQAE